MPKIDAEKLYRESEVAKLLGVKSGTLQQWRSLGRGPAWVKLGRAVYFHGSDLKAFIAAQRRVPSKQGEARA